MRYRLNRHTDIYFVERSWNRQAKWLGLVAGILALILLSGCSLGEHSRHLHPNLDMPRNLANVEVYEEIIPLPVLYGPARCAVMAFDNGHYGAGALMIGAGAVGALQFGCALWGPEPAPRRLYRVDAKDTILAQRHTCHDVECWAKVYYFPDPFGVVYNDEIHHAMGYTDHHPKVAKLGHDESLFDKSQQDR